MKIQTKLIALLLLALMHVLGLANANAALDASCVISILNRTVQVNTDGGWSMPNVPSAMGRVRARATCLQNGQTVSGESDYFTVLPDGIAQVGSIHFDNLEQIPTNLAFSDPNPSRLNGLAQTLQLTVNATYAGGNTSDVTLGLSGTNYSSTNPAIATVSENGLVSGLVSGSVIISARKDGVLAVKQFSISATGDTDGDGMPDDYETANGLNPNDPVDAQEDRDKDGLTALQEFQAGTDPNKKDSDGDGISDGEELVAGADGFITNPLSNDTDGDGLTDNLEALAGSSPINAASTNWSGALVSLSVTPSRAVMNFNTIDPESTLQLQVTGTMLDGSRVDMTNSSRGTFYASNNLAVVSFGASNGLLFAGQSGNASVTVNNNGLIASTNVVVNSFSPRALSYVAIPGYANNVDVAGDYAYVAAGAFGLQIVQLGDRTAPVVVAGLDTLGTSIDVRVVGNLAYVADGANGLQIFDITNPTAPVLKGAVDTTGIAQDLQIATNYAYIADGTSGLQIVDITDPAAPVLTGVLGGLGDIKGVAIDGNTAVVVTDDALHVIDVGNRAQPALLGTISQPGIPAKDVALRGNFAYIAAYSSGWGIVNISNPAVPVLVSGDIDFAPRDVELGDKQAFFAEQLFPNVIAYINIQDPLNAVFSGTIDLSLLGDYAGTGVALDNRYVYVTEENFVVGQDYGTSGNTRLFIAQYRFPSDTGQVEPTVEITNPTNGATLIEGETIKVRITATDDVYVAGVNTYVNGNLANTDTASPYEMDYTIPTGFAQVAFGADALDLAANVGVATNVQVNVIPDPLTNIVGSVVDNVGAPVSGASVICEGSSSLSNSDGSFIVASANTISGDISCTASLDQGQGLVLTGLSQRIAPVRGGQTNVGAFTLSISHFETDIGTNLNLTDDSSVNIPFINGFSFPMNGVSYAGVYVSSNGWLTFNFGDNTFSQSITKAGEQPNVLAFFDDLLPSGLNNVYVKQFSDRFVVTWLNIQHYSLSGSNTIQVVLYNDGRIQIGYKGITSVNSGTIIGISPSVLVAGAEHDFSVEAPFSVTTPQVIYEYFTGDTDMFDLDQQLLIFTPNGSGGYGVTERPLQ